ncbi:MAG: hypothetical protein ABSG65_22270 [Bryobacteraceae bacterium]|jgi:hypothetical protein
MLLNQKLLSKLQNHQKTAVLSCNEMPARYTIVLSSCIFDEQGALESGSDVRFGIMPLLFWRHYLQKMSSILDKRIPCALTHQE